MNRYVVGPILFVLMRFNRVGMFVLFAACVVSEALGWRIAGGLFAAGAMLFAAFGLGLFCGEQGLGKAARGR